MMMTTKLRSWGGRARYSSQYGVAGKIPLERGEKWIRIGV